MINTKMLTRLALAFALTISCSANLFGQNKDCTPTPTPTPTPPDCDDHDAVCDAVWNAEGVPLLPGTTLGVVVCCGGDQIICTFPNKEHGPNDPPEGPYKDFKYCCVEEHEKDHRDRNPGTSCNPSSDWGLAMPEDDDEKNADECSSYLKELECLEGHNPNCQPCSTDSCEGLPPSQYSDCVMAIILCQEDVRHLIEDNIEGKIDHYCNPTPTPTPTPTPK